MLFNYAGSRTEAKWVRVNKLHTLRLFWYTITNYVALDTCSTNGLGSIKIVLTSIRARIYIYYRYAKFRLWKNERKKEKGVTH